MTKLLGPESGKKEKCGGEERHARKHEQKEEDDKETDFFSEQMSVTYLICSSSGQRTQLMISFISKQEPKAHRQCHNEAVRNLLNVKTLNN